MSDDLNVQFNDSPANDAEAREREKQAIDGLANCHAICMSGTYDLGRFLDGDMTDDLFVSSPVHYVPTLSGEHLERLRTRFVLLPSGEGRAEDIEESWRVARILGDQSIPNRVDSWGEDWDHDWPTWRNMLVRYVDEYFPADT